LLKSTSVDGARFEFRTESRRLLAHVLNQIGTQNAIRETGENSQTMVVSESWPPGSKPSITMG